MAQAFSKATLPLNPVARELTMSSTTKKTMEQRFPRPDWVRRLNLMGDSVGGAQNMVSLDVDEMVNLASQSTRLNDFGDNIDGDWRGRLNQLVQCIETEAKPNVVGRLMARQEILRSLRTRLFLAKKLKDHPAILDEEIREPIIITGTGRSGTSITLELLSLDPNCHSPIAWQGLHPASDNEDPDHLRAISECEEEFWSDIVPEMAAIHELRADLPEECIALQKPSFAGMFWWVLHDLKSWPMYFEEAMQFHKVALQALQYGKPASTWILKTPTYLPILDLVFATYPDAWIVLNHRDPLKTIASGVSTLAAGRWIRSDNINTDELVAMTTAGGGSGMMLDVHRRRQNGELPDRFVDLHFSDLMDKPVEAIQSLYAAIGRTFEASHAETIAQYLKEKPRAKFGKHSYTFESWGIDPNAIREGSEEYYKAFNVKPEV